MPADGVKPHQRDRRPVIPRRGETLPGRRRSALPRFTADALLTQRRLADYLLGRGADYLFTVKGTANSF